MSSSTTVGGVLPWATAPYILRAVFKDQYLSETLVGESLQDVVNAVFGARFANQHDSTVSQVAVFLYYVASSVVGGQSPGEEYCDTLQVVQSGHLVTPTTKLRKLLLAALLATQSSMLSVVAKRLFPAYTPTDVVNTIRKLFSAIFYLTDVYVTIPHRLCGVQYVSTQRRMGGSGKPGAYFRYGVLQLIELLIRWYANRRPREDGRGRLDVEENSNDDEAESDETDGVTGHCTLCLGQRKYPTATNCGHMYCWKCITSWIRSNHNPACPICRQHLEMKHLVPLAYYVATK
jgi:peroxin-10